MPVEVSEPGAGLIRLSCVGVRRETPTIRSFLFETQASFEHEAGQAMTLKVPYGGEDLMRTFSIFSAPAEGKVEITIKAHAQGRATNWLHRHILAGATIEAWPPRGRFTLEGRRPGAPLAFVSAGPGATPLMSMLRSLVLVEPDADIAWFHLARAPDERRRRPEHRLSYGGVRPYHEACRLASGRRGRRPAISAAYWGAGHRGRPGRDDDAGGAAPGCDHPLRLRAGPMRYLPGREGQRRDRSPS
ncbi:FAD-binding oxidoreductase [Labrys miyagiensis]|uniref:FAD-binding oxidoreductase n=1 Tax=Labrys miyagiensis TaxID=346912 RepID=UPI0024E08BC5|nr:FAD-binding oxidoreductase [Labrys miyagiensis]